MTIQWRAPHRGLFVVSCVLVTLFVVAAWFAAARSGSAGWLVVAAVYTVAMAACGVHGYLVAFRRPSK